MTQYVRPGSSTRSHASSQWGVRDLRRRPQVREPGFAIYAVEVFENYVEVTTGNDKFNWMIPEDLDGSVLVKVEGYVNTTGGGNCEVMVTKVPDSGIPVDMLTDKVIIAPGELNSFEAPGQVGTVDPSEEGVIWGDHLRFDVDAAGGALGLGMILYFTPLETASVAVQGAQGPPGGAVQPQGQWQTATSYTSGQAVSNNGSSYIVIVEHTSGAATEPGVGVDWEDAWMLLSQAQAVSGIAASISGNGYVLDTGVKAYVMVPFDCTITAAYLISHTVGDIVVDIWKDDYGNHPATDADSITGGTPLTLSASNKTLDTGLTGWTTSLSQGDVLAYNIDSVSQIGLLTVGLDVERI